MKYLINTTTHGGLLGVQVDLVSHDAIDEIRTTVTRQVIDTYEKSIRAALIRLGWTPPPEGFIEA